VRCLHDASLPFNRLCYRLACHDNNRHRYQPNTPFWFIFSCLTTCIPTACNSSVTRRRYDPSLDNCRHRLTIPSPTPCCCTDRVFLVDNTRARTDVAWTTVASRCDVTTQCTQAFCTVVSPALMTAARMPLSAHRNNAAAAPMLPSSCYIEPTLACWRDRRPRSQCNNTACDSSSPTSVCCITIHDGIDARILVTMSRRQYDDKTKRDNDNQPTDQPWPTYLFIFHGLFFDNDNIILC